MKETGILLAVSSLPSPTGVGELGRPAYEWIDLLAENGVSIWQILPLNPTGYGNSPYQPYSSCAGDELYLSLELLAQQGLLPQAPAFAAAKPGRVDYKAVRAWKEPLLRAAWAAFEPGADYRAFADQMWVKHYSVFRAFKRANQSRCWLEWPQWQRDWPQTRQGDLGEFEAEIAYHTFLQYQFLLQWKAVREYAHAKGVRIMGDVPFYVGIDSVDVWAGRENFLLDADGRPTFIAGVPPDYFSATGQRWGNPIYNWDKMEKDGFAFWVERMGYNQQLFDIIRIDHFRAFDTYWKIPASCPTAIQGEWLEAPGYAVLDTLYEKIPGLELVAEDLGDLRPQVLELRDAYQLPGMDVLLFRMEPKLLKRPARKNSIVYTGTHDNDTAEEAYGKFTHNRRIALRRFFHNRGYAERNFHDLLVHFAFDSDANYVIIPLQDILGLKGEGHMNHPGTIGSPNWEWKLKDYKKLTRELEKVKVWLLQAQRSTCREEIK